MKKQLPNLYPLRFILSLFVVLFHQPLISKTVGIPYYNNLPLFNKGELSVFYFFTLSGFLIIRLIYIQLAIEKEFNIKEFYMRRIRRLYPVYYLVFVIGIILYHVLLPLLHISFDIDYKLSELIINYVLFIPNVFKFHHPDVGSILIVLWSIGVEEQFYLFIPILLLFFKKQILKFLGFLLIISLLLLYVNVSIYQYNNFYFYFIAGGLVAIISLREKPIKLFSSLYLHIIVYFGFILSFFTNYLVFESELLTHTINLILSTLLINIIANYPKFVINNKLLNYLGKVSYGIYMYHMIVITFLLFIIKKTGFLSTLHPMLFIPAVNILVVLFTLLVSHLSFQYYESLFYENTKQNNHNNVQ